MRNKDKWARYRKKRHNTNPSRGPYHFRAPSKMLYRVVKGMLPAKTFRGKQMLVKEKRVKRKNLIFNKN